MALSFVGLPVQVLAPGSLNAVLAGLSDTCLRAGCAIIGGHTMKDSEPKCGLAVVGSVDPDQLWSHRFATAGQAIVLTKPIGTGLVGQSVRQGTANPAALAEATKQMMSLNDVAAKVGRDVGATACTDVTGFGLLGHLKHIAEASAVEIEIDSGAVPLFDGVTQLAREGCVPGGSRRNLTYAEGVTHFAPSVDQALQLVLADAQTSGGLVLCLPEERAEEAVARLQEGGCVAAARIGRVAKQGPGTIIVN